MKIMKLVALGVAGYLAFSYFEHPHSNAGQLAHMIVAGSSQLADKASGAAVDALKHKDDDAPTAAAEQCPNDQACSYNGQAIPSAKEFEQAAPAAPTMADATNEADFKKLCIGNDGNTAEDCDGLWSEKQYQGGDNKVAAQ